MMKSRMKKRITRMKKIMKKETMNSLKMIRKK